MTGIVNSDVAIVGAGMLGASVAYHLAAAGAKPLVLEANRPAGGATLNTFAWVNAVGKRPQHYFELNRLGMAEHRRLAEELGGEWYHPGGNLEWEHPDSGGLAAKVDALRAWGYAVEWVDRSALGALVPGVSVAPEVERAAFYRDDAFIDAVPLVAHLLNASSSITLWPGARVTRLEHRPGSAVGVTTGDGRRVAADRVIMCPGAAAGEMVRLAGFELPMRESSGLLAVTEPAPVVLGRVLHAPGVAIRPDGGGRLMLQAESVDRGLKANGGDLDIGAAVDDLAQRAARVLPGLAGSAIELHRIGARALTADGLPAVGPLPDLEAVYVAITHSGITLGPLIGRLVASEILNGGETEELSPYRPQRFTRGPES